MRWTSTLEDVEVRTASLADVIRSKEAAGRERDRQALPTLRRLLESIGGFRLLERLKRGVIAPALDSCHIVVRIMYIMLNSLCAMRHRSVPASTSLESHFNLLDIPRVFRVELSVRLPAFTVRDKGRLIAVTAPRRRCAGPRDSRGDGTPTSTAARRPRDSGWRCPTMFNGIEIVSGGCDPQVLPSRPRRLRGRSERPSRVQLNCPRCQTTLQTLSG